MDNEKMGKAYSIQLMINMLKSSYTVCAMVSEEDENVIEVEVGKQGS
jgi:fructose-1,6-bisphosphatase